MTDPEIPRSQAPGTIRHRPEPPSHSEIAEAWASLSVDELTAVFPNLPALWIGWGEPFCFRCGWLPPVPSAADTFQNRRQAWNGVGAWLEKAHLHDHAKGGSSDPTNFVTLCVLCHRQQPVCANRDAGIQYVNTPTKARAVSLLQAATDSMFTGRRPAGHDQTLRWMLRAKGFVADVLAEVTS